MDKLIFERGKVEDFEYKEPERIEFEVQQHLNIWEFKVCCMRLAAALGYHQNSISNAFGSEISDEDEANWTVGYQDITASGNIEFDLDSFDVDNFLDRLNESRNNRKERDDE